MNIVFCADERVLPGLHVAAYSLLARLQSTGEPTRFFICSESLTEADIELLGQTLAALKKPFVLKLQRLNATTLADAPRLNGSIAPYYRLLAVPLLPVDRVLYVDADTLCDVDVGELDSVNLDGVPAGWVPEAPLAEAGDRRVAAELGNRPDEPYFNSGVMLINAAEWRRQKVTEAALNYINATRPAYHDQSALNVVLHRNSAVLSERYNCIANMRKHWPALARGWGRIDRLVHLVDYPKPWDFGAEFVHPQYRLWRAALDRTSLKGHRLWAKRDGRLPRVRDAWRGYGKSLKDRMLFGAYLRGWKKRVKGIP